MYPPGQPPTIYYNYAKPGRTSGLAIASMVLGIVWVYWIGSILAVIFGHIAISQTSRDETLRGRGMPSPVWCWATSVSVPCCSSSLPRLRQRAEPSDVGRWPRLGGDDFTVAIAVQHPDTAFTPFER
jgi:hypothetical protein